MDAGLLTAVKPVDGAGDDMALDLWPFGVEILWKVLFAGATATEGTLAASGDDGSMSL